jgi:signal transduction histidine kinase/PAS domain-containing protein
VSQLDEKAGEALEQMVSGSACGWMTSAGRGWTPAFAEACTAAGGTAESMLLDLEKAPPGRWPLLFGDRLVFCGILEFGQHRLFSLEAPASPGEAVSFLDSLRGSHAAYLVSPDGLVISESSAARSLYSPAAGRKMGDILVSRSISVYSGALADCLASGESSPFTVEIMDSEGGKTTAVLAMRRMPTPWGAILITLDQPSLSVAGFCPAETSYIDTIFRSIPLPAVVTSPEGMILRMNDAALSVAEASLGGNPVNTMFVDWIEPVDRESVAAIHRKRMEGGYAPYSYEVHLGSEAGPTMTVEVTALQMPEGKDTLAFLLPSEGLAGRGPGHSGMIGNLLSTLKSGSTTDTRRTVLEVLRVGTGARGVAMMTGSTLSTAGEVPKGTPGDAPEPTGESAGESWQRTPDGLFDVNVMTRLRSGPCRITVYGVQSNMPFSLTRLILGFAPLLADYVDSIDNVRTVMETFGAILDTWNTLTEEKGGLVRFLDRAAATSGASRVYLWGPAGPDGNLPLLASTGLGRDPSPLNPQSETSGGWAYTHSETVYVADTLRDSRFTPLTQESRSELSVPLLQGRRAQGVLSAVSDTPGAFGSPSPGILRLFAVVLSFWLLSRQSGSKPDSGGEPRGRGTPAQEIDDILLSLGHRLRAPAAAISGFAEMLSAGRLGPLGEDAAEAVAALSRSSESLVDSSDRLLALVRLVLRDDRAELTWGHPEEVVEGLTPTLRRKAETAALRFRTELPGTGFTAMFDRSRLEEVILELVDNAVRYNRPGGDVSIKVRQEGTAWTLEIEDTGRGIPSRSLPYIFDRFYHSTDDGRSLGIGLTIVRRLVEKLGGTVTVFSREGKGSRFLLRFPLSAQ